MQNYNNIHSKMKFKSTHSMNANTYKYQIKIEG
jgi:hypothetical protein